LLGDGGRQPLDRGVDARISRLRRKQQPEEREDGREERIVKTVDSAGYMLVAQVEWERRPAATRTAVISIFLQVSD
jgi:DNA-binding winged helix-turn-helix (wHTH) protein